MMKQNIVIRKIETERESDSNEMEEADYEENESDDKMIEDVSKEPNSSNSSGQKAKKVQIVKTVPTCAKSKSKYSCVERGKHFDSDIKVLYHHCQYNCDPFIQCWFCYLRFDIWHLNEKHNEES